MTTDDNELKEIKKRDMKEDLTPIEKYRSTILALLFGVPVISLFLYPVFFENAGTGYFIDTFSFLFIYAAISLTLNLEIGYLGLPNFGKVAFIMVGAYTYAIVENTGWTVLGLPIWIMGLIMAGIMTGLAGVVLTLPTLRLREDYFAIVTIVGGEILRLIFNNETSLGGFSGFPVSNVIYQQREVGEKLGGVNFELEPFIFAIIIGIVSLLVFQYYQKKYAEVFEQNSTIIKYSLQKAITVSIILGIVAIYMNFTQAMFSSSIILDIFAIGFPLLLTLLKSMDEFLNGLSVNHVWMTYGGSYALVLLSFIIGLINGRGVSDISVVSWYFMLVTAILMLIIYVILQEIYYSPFGRTMRAIREDDTSAMAIGKSVFEFRLKGLVVSNFLTGIIGAIFGWLLTNVTPQTFLPQVTFLLYIMVIIGGTGNNKGVIFGAIVVQLLIQTTRRLTNLDLYYPYTDRPIHPINLALILTGVVLIVFLIYAPEGIFPEQRKHNDRYYEMLNLHRTDAEELKSNPVLNFLVKASGTSIDELTKEELYE